MSTPYQIHALHYFLFIYFFPSRPQNPGRCIKYWGRNVVNHSYRAQHHLPGEGVFDWQTSIDEPFGNGDNMAVPRKMTGDLGALWITKDNLEEALSPDLINPNCLPVLEDFQDVLEFFIDIHFLAKPISPDDLRNSIAPSHHFLLIRLHYHRTGMNLFFFLCLVQTSPIPRILVIISGLLFHSFFVILFSRLRSNS